MRRRELITLIGCGLWPGAGRAQQSMRTRRIGVLFALAESDRQGQARLAAFRNELQRLGWGDATLETRYVASNDAETHQRLAKELVALQPDLILAQNTDNTDALLQQTRTIPILFTIVSDPVGSGFVESFSRPGRNVTGFITNEPTMGGKWVELLREIAPSVTRVLVPYNTAPLAAEYFMKSVRAAAAPLGIDARAAQVRDVSELGAVVADFAATPLGALIYFPDAYLTGHRAEVTSLAARYRLPTIYPSRFFADGGGLLSYGSDLLDNFRRAAVYADRIFRGAKVGELPVQAPEKFELVVNLKAARALDLDVPAIVVARADHVIE